MCSPPPLCTLCWSATRPRLSIMRRFCLICSWQCISCYPERRICCMSSGWTRKLWRRPWRGSDILWSKTSSPPTSGSGRSPSKSAFWSAIYRRKNLRKFIFLYKQQILFYFLCRIWFWLHYVNTILHGKRLEKTTSKIIQATCTDAVMKPTRGVGKKRGVFPQNEDIISHRCETRRVGRVLNSSTVQYIHILACLHFVQYIFSMLTWCSDSAGGHLVRAPLWNVDFLKVPTWHFVRVPLCKADILFL